MTGSKKRELIEQLNRLAWLINRHRQMNHWRGPMNDPHRGQGRVLSLLNMNPNMSQKELLYLLDMRPQSLGELLGKLERVGYIERTPSEMDKRAMIIHLTEAGKEAASKKPGEEHGLDALFNCLSEEEQGQLSGYLGRLLEAMEMQADERDAMNGPEDFTHPHAGPFGHREHADPFGLDEMTESLGNRERTGRVGHGEYSDQYGFSPFDRLFKPNRREMRRNPWRGTGPSDNDDGRFYGCDRRCGRPCDESCPNFEPHR